MHTSEIVLYTVQ